MTEEGDAVSRHHEMPAAATYYPSLLFDYLAYAVVLAYTGTADAACAVASFEACKPPRPPLVRTCRDPWTGRLSIVNGTCNTWLV
jgi:hypothetical protein